MENFFGTPVGHFVALIIAVGFLISMWKHILFGIISAVLYGIVGLFLGGLIDHPMGGAMIGAILGFASGMIAAEK